MIKPIHIRHKDKCLSSWENFIMFPEDEPEQIEVVN